jgi:hypothetical protein
VPTATQFYREVLRAISAADLPFMVGGAYAFCRYAGIDRGTKDLDLMICETDWPAVARVLRRRGIHARLVFPHWLGKALAGHAQVDIIFSGGNGLTRVDGETFRHATTQRVLGHVVAVCPVEDLIWSKAFIMERERFDGADVLHLLRARADVLDWSRLCRRFAGHEGVLLAHLVLFRYVYPGEAARVPTWVLPWLTTAAEAPAPHERLCRGPLLSRAQYLIDVEQWGYFDVRRPPFGQMSSNDWLKWTNAINAAQSRVKAARRTSAPRGPLSRANAVEMTVGAQKDRPVRDGR